jgi:AraC-like DNA-binding protein
MLMGRTASRRVGRTAFLASAATSHELVVDGSDGWHLSILTFGAANMRADGRGADLVAGRNALLLPNLKRSVISSDRSVLIATIDKDILLRTASTMMAGGSDRQMNDCIHDLPIEHRKGVFASFLQLFRMLDATRGDDGIAGALGIEELLYRWLVIALGWLDDLSCKMRGGSVKLDDLCDMIRSSFERPLTLTEMERATGLSSRSLQYAFRERFGCSPTEWQRRERMLMAQHRLIADGPDGSITDLAYAMAFSSSSAFATLYKRHFGETPSQTKARLFGPELSQI